MSAFEYKALDAAGREKKGVHEADAARQVRQYLREQGMTPLAVVEVQQKEAKRGGGFSLQRGINPADLALITRQLATLSRAGTPVDTALQAVSRQTEKPRISNMLLAVRAKVKEGHPVATAMGDFPHIFNELYRATVSAGEQSGHMDGVLERLADYTESSHEMRQKFQLAMIYPALIVLVALGVVVGLLGYVVPKVVAVFEGTGQALPWLTRALITLSEFVQTYGLYMGGVAVVGAIIFVIMMRKEGFRRKVHRITLSVPLIGRLTRGVNTARFARTFSILAGSGVAVLDAMRIAAAVVTNLPMRAAVDEAARRVREGTPINKALEASGYFPPMTVHLIASGEASGNLDDMLDRAATTQEREVETLVAMLLGILEPLMIVVMGVVVLVIVLAILLPILNMNQLIR